MNKIKVLTFFIFFLIPFENIFSKEDSPLLIKQNWPFEGIFGRFDYSSIQRGFQVYREVCAGCHGIRHIAYRNLEEIGFSKDEVKAIASEYELADGPNDEGEMYDRLAKPTDKFVGPYLNSKEARLANNGAYPPDLSLIVKARKGGADYLYHLLNGYKEPPSNFELSDGMYYNTIYAGNQISMPAPIVDDIVEYFDNTPATQDQIIRDITSFLVWTSEPELEERKSMGVKVLFFLVLITLMLLAVKRKVWKDVN